MNGQYNLEKELLEPYTHLLQVRGKQFRNRIVIAFNHWFKVPEDQLQSSLEIATMFHNASLLLDDIQDGSVVRRGMPAAHCVFGLPLTINAALQVFTKALQKSLKLVPNGLGLDIYAENLYHVVYGQGIDIYWRDNFICPTEAEYRQMVQQKTGGMLMFGVKFLQLFSENKKNYEDFVLLLGLYFQMRDDYCNLKQQKALEEWPGEDDIHAKNNNNFCEDITEGKFSLPIIHAMTTPEGPEVLKTGGMIMFGVKFLQLFSENKKNYEDFVLLLGLYFQMRDDYCNLKQQKALEEWPGEDDIHAKNNNNFCEDITEGKFSLPIIHAMTTPEGPQVLSILRKRTRDVELKKYCVSLLEKSGSLQYTRDALSQCDRDARAELARLGGNPLMEAVLDGLLTWKGD